MDVLRDTVCSRLYYKLHFVLITALIVIINFVREHSKQYHAIRSCEYFAVIKGVARIFGRGRSAI